MGVRTCVAKLKSVGCYSQSKFITTPRSEKEGADEHEKRCWRERCHVGPDGRVFIPPMQFKSSLDEAARRASIRIRGRGQATYTKHIEAGVLVTDGIVLPIKQADVEGEWLHLNADGKKNGSKRVMRCMPLIRDWSGEVRYYVTDDTITEDVFERVLEDSGKLVGIGRFRPAKCGYYGRFTVESLRWE